jgi:integrase
VTEGCAICRLKNRPYKCAIEAVRSSKFCSALSGNDSMATKTSAEYVKVPNVVGLYRHVRSGGYHGVKKIHGKRRERSLRTADRQIAERRLRHWINTLQRTDREKERTTFRQLIAMFVAAHTGKSASTQTTHRSVIKRLTKTWRFGLDMEVRDIRPSHLEEWLALEEARLKNTSYNRYAGCVRQMFQIAVNDRIIAESPFDHVKTQWKKPQTPVRLVPTEAQFQAIVQSIRTRRFTDHAQDSADFVEFLGLAGLGQAEASALCWADIDWRNERFSVRRRKTGALFYVPIYPALRPLLESIKRRAGKAAPSRAVFAVKDAKKALQAACERLGFPRFSQRSIRRFHIGRLWRSGVDRKLISKWQGHRDGGKLIIDTYTEMFGADDSAYEQQQLAKLGRAA